MAQIKNINKLHHYDVVIVGAGLVGLALSLALRKFSSLKVAIIEASLPKHNDTRLFALSVSSWQLLQHIGVADELASVACPIRGIQVSRQGHFGAVRFNAKEMNLNALGYMVPAANIEKVLEDKNKQHHATCIRPATLVGLTQQEDHVELLITTPEGKRKITADSVIGADGAHSTVRQLLGVNVDIEDDQQSALVTHTTVSQSHQHIAYERFVKDGAIAMLPLRDDKVATIWSGHRKFIHELQEKTDGDFIAALQQNFGYRLGRITSVAKRTLFPLKFSRAVKMNVDRVLLIGNAAHTVHPIAAQGFNLALYEVALFVDKLQQHDDVPSAQLFQELAVAAQNQQNISLSTTQQISQQVMKPSMLVRACLPMGMFVFDKVTPLKKIFLQNMLGRGKKTPRLLCH